MDTTEQRSGFRLPWTDRRDSDVLADGSAEPDASPGESGTEDVQMAEQMGEPVGQADMGAADAVPTDSVNPTTDPSGQGVKVPRRPSRFLEDLARAMRTAAEEGRQSALEQFHADGKRTMEEIQSRSTDDATAIRRQADEDVTHVREWSKAEIARIREETERRIAERKEHLDRQLEGHAAVVEREIEHVREQVEAYDRDMAVFFDALLAEEDPGRFAALATSLPEPPPFTPVSEAERLEIEARAMAGPPALEEPEAEVEVSDGSEVPFEVAAAEGFRGEDASLGPDVEVAAVAPVAADAAAEADASVPDAMEPDSAEADARLAALDDAERAALEDVVPDEGDAAANGASLSARLAGLVATTRPEAAPDATPDDGPTTKTQVVVTGLTSVASIAAFKRHLSRLDGVRTVAVSSGPSEEFVFAIVHGDGRPLADGIASMTGFAPRIDRVDSGEIVVTARDPES